MAKLIVADELRQRMYHECMEVDHSKDEMQKWDSGCWIRYKLFLKVLDETPPVDAVPVIRCKDCKYLEHHKVFGWRCMNDYYVSPDDDFCSSASRRDSNG